MKYNQIEDNEWVKPIRKGFKEACCDCGLVHRTEFRLVDGVILFRSVRDNRATAAVRRTLKAKGQLHIK